jgi:adenylate kinase family enzyme
VIPVRVPARPAAQPLGSPAMQRVAIIGCGGSGKSRLARHLGARLGVTPVHLDALYYDQNWEPLDQDAFGRLQAELVTAPRWVIDGNYAATLPIRLRAADTVIFLDLPARACLLGIVQRRLRHHGGQHPAAGVFDRITPGFVSYILGYRTHMARRVRALIAAHAAHADVTVLRSRAAVRRYLAGPAIPPASPGQDGGHEQQG